VPPGGKDSAPPPVQVQAGKKEKHSVEIQNVRVKMMNLLSCTKIIKRDNTQHSIHMPNYPIVKVFFILKTLHNFV